MLELDCSMSDTLDNFSFGDIKTQNARAISDKSQPRTKEVSSEVSFDDSQFVDEVLFNLDISHCLNNMKSSQGNNLSHNQSSLYNCTNDKIRSLETFEETILVKSQANESIALSKLQNPINEAVPPTSQNRTSISSDVIHKTVASNSESKSEDSSSLGINITKEMCHLSSWNLPEPVLNKYESKSMATMFPWQCECLCKAGVLHGLTNLIYSAPTSAGKTLVAEILALKTIFNRKKKVIFILPFVSIVKEKMYYFRDLLEGTGIRVEGYMGSYNPPGGFSAIHFAICTIEKANSLINRLLEEETLSDVGAVFVDEMHLLGDPHRGYLLELLLTKLRYISIKQASLQIQIIGMSATLPNLGELATWLGAELYSTSFRPIPLFEQVIVCGEVYDRNFELLRKLEPLPDLGIDTDNILQLCLEVIRDSYSVLIFCPTKKWCESLALQLSSAFFKIGNSQTPLGDLLRAQIKSDLIMEVLEQLKLCPIGLDSILKKTVSFGIGFHHAGLTMDERDIVEGSFRSGALKVLAATSTLSSGVNLPARRVIIRSPVFCGSPLDLLTYRQMIGRAGRLGKDTQGESILVCHQTDYSIAKQLLNSELPAVRSCLQASGKLKRAILEVIASGVASTPTDVALFANCTLLALSSEDEDARLDNPIEEALEYLKRYEFIRLQKDDSGADIYMATSLGKACLSSSIGPDEAITLFTELERARRCFVLETELHLIYLVTPYTASHSWGAIDWIFYLDLWNKLPAAMKRVGELVGILESYIVGATMGRLGNITTAKQQHKLMVHKRFLVALVLQDLVNEVPLVDVCAKFNCNRGMLQSLQQSAATFAGMVTSFSRQLGWSTVEILLAQFQDRLQFGISRDLLDLMRLPSITSKLARTLYKSGVQTLVKLANSRMNTIESILYKAGPFESSNDSEEDGKDRKKLKTVWIIGKDGLTQGEAADLLVKEARSYLEYEMGLREAKWTTQSDRQEVSDNTQDNNISKVISAQSESSKEFNVTQQSEQLKEFNEKALNCEQQPELRISSSSSTVNSDQEQKPNTSTSSLNISDSSLFGTSDNDSFNKCIISTDSSESFSLQLSDEDVSRKIPDSKILNNPIRNESDFQNQEKKRMRISFGESSKATPKKKLKMTEDLNGSLMQLSLEDTDYCELAPHLGYQIVDVCKSRSLFKKFIELLEGKSDIAFSVVHKKLKPHIPTIGQNIGNTKPTSADLILDINSNKNKDAISFLVYWGGTQSNFLSPDNDTLVLMAKYFKNDQRNVLMCNAKKYIKMLIENYNFEFHCSIGDPKVADWLLDVDGKEKSIGSMVNHYYDDFKPDIRALCDHMNKNSNYEPDPKLKGSAEVILTWHLMELIRKKLLNRIPTIFENKLDGFLSIYDLEMNTLLAIAKMELSGISVERAALQNLVSLLNEQKGAIERKAYSLAGRKFNFTSSSDVSKVIGTYTGKKTSTKRKILERNEHPISDLVILWRKLNFTLTQTIYPLLRQCRNSRIYGTYDGHTSTGRITMHEPNIQMVPKDFKVSNPSLQKDMTVSCRTAFSVSKGQILISADYCQLELRVLTYLSKDRLLLEIMGKPGDIFKSIAAKWNNVSEDNVDDTMRQYVKQLCYGIIYGMGGKSLAEQMEISIEDAVEFMETFRNTYPGMKEFIKKTVEDCKKNGYVESLAGRRRYFPHINHADPSIRGQAERQAVNTRVQGSAADIVKTAMIAIDSKMETVFRKSHHKPMLVLHLHDELVYEVSEKYVEKAVKIIKTGMEKSAGGFGNFPVKVKTGYSWGQLNEYSAK